MAKGNRSSLKEFAKDALSFNEQPKPLNIPKTERVESFYDLSEIERLAIELQKKMANWGMKKKERFIELQKEGFDFSTAFLIVEKYQGINPGFKKGREND